MGVVLIRVWLESKGTDADESTAARRAVTCLAACTLRTSRAVTKQVRETNAETTRSCGRTPSPEREYQQCRTNSEEEALAQNSRGLSRHGSPSRRELQSHYKDKSSGVPAVTGEKVFPTSYGKGLKADSFTRTDIDLFSNWRLTAEPKVSTEYDYLGDYTNSIQPSSIHSKEVRQCALHVHVDEDDAGRTGSPSDGQHSCRHASYRSLRQGAPQG
ncbi:hypothetical protein BJ546DRAFT_947998 [Cryomyces antarcticus]